MRLLSNHHVYREVQPDTFANTRISSTFDTGKSVEEIHAESVLIGLSLVGFFLTYFLFLDRKINMSEHLVSLL